MVAVNEDARESDPAQLDPVEAVRRLEAATGRPVRLVDGIASLTGREDAAGVPRWTLFLGIALTCLVAETIVSARWRPSND